MKTIIYQAIDPAVLMQLAGDRATFRSLSQTFSEHAPGVFQRLQAAVRSADQSGIAHESHALKNMTTMVGAQRLSALLQTMETAARDSRVAAAADLLQQFTQVLAEVNMSIDDDAIEG